MKRKRPDTPDRKIEREFYPAGRKRGALVTQSVEYDDKGRLLRYSLALIDAQRFGPDNGRVVGYDSSHGHHHRHCGGKVEPIRFVSFEALLDRFEREVNEYLEQET